MFPLVQTSLFTVLLYVWVMGDWMDGGDVVRGIHYKEADTDSLVKQTMQSNNEAKYVTGWMKIQDFVTWSIKQRLTASSGLLMMPLTALST